MNKIKEAHIQKKLEIETGGKHDKCANGIPDIVSDTQIIEIKEWNKYKDAFGQIEFYRRHYPDKQPRIHFFGEKIKNIETLRIIYEVANEKNILITEENSKNESILKTPLERPSKYYKKSEKYMRKVILELLNNLDVKIFEYEETIEFIKAIKSINTNFCDLAYDFLKPQGHSLENFVSFWNDLIPENNGLNFLMKYLKTNVNVTEYKKFKIQHIQSYNFLYKEYIDKLDYGLSMYLAKKTKKKFVSLDSSRKNYYKWNEKTKFWEKSDMSFLDEQYNKKLMGMLYKTIKYYNDYILYLGSKLNNCDNSSFKKLEKYTLISTRCERIRYSYCMKRNMSSISKICTILLINKDFERNLDNISRYIPIQDGKILDSITGEIRLRTREDMYTKELDGSCLKDINKIPNPVKEDINPVKQFFLECCSREINSAISASTLYKAFNDWKPESIPNISQTKFGTYMSKQLKIDKCKDSHGCVVYKGIRFGNKICS